MITLVKGCIETDDGQVREFQIAADGHIFQWGNVTERLGDTVDAVTDMRDVLVIGEYLA